MNLNPSKRTFTKVAVVLLAALLTVVVAAAENECPETLLSRSITFEPGRSYEVTGIWVKPENMQVLNEYFSKVFPIAAADYGVKPLFSLQPLQAYAGDFTPQILFVNEWPSVESFQAFTQDPRAVALFPERDAAIERLVVTQYRVPQRVTTSLTEGDVVELGAMWLSAGGAEALGDYYKKVFPIALRHGMKPLTPLATAYAYKGDFSPERAGLNVWPDLDAFHAFEAEAKPLFAQRDAALERLEVTHARLHFEGER